MAKINKPFQFNYTLKHKVIRDCKIVTVTVGLLEIEGMGYLNTDGEPIDIHSRYGADIDFIKWNGTDIKPVLEITSQCELSDIEDAVLRHVKELFEKDKEAIPMTQVEALNIFFNHINQYFLPKSSGGRA